MLLQERINYGVTNFYQRDNIIFLRELNTATQFSELSWRWYDDVPILKGIYHFQINYRGIPFQDSFNLEFYFPHDYPENLPLVKELDNKIPKEFHHFTDGSLCLCTPAEQWLIFSKNPTLENYIKNLVNPYLLCWLWYEKFNEMPWGERQHGPVGIIESYQDLLKLNNPEQTLHFLKILFFNEIDSRGYCPCGSGLSFRKCHKTAITKVTNRLPMDYIKKDFITILRG